ncbi:hypothetical protein P7D22_07065 [Lichenihabitans sp. Uapishka_5]|uniref:hypothetical protein n=1 Tax=Lichenihabitans sp. Uapishka_5 TaxID=3037302 RepID=UPI0029E81BC8|nr:hypothetical protein [Lichenihabitans sp. Uapishka_5]MDX7950938.1 hypothetical protein [Lichenihabitans sp. Uapishka_5]
MRRDRQFGIRALALLLGAGLAAFQPTAASARQSLSFTPGQHDRSHGVQAEHSRHRVRSVRPHVRSGVARAPGGAARGRAVASQRETVDDGPAAKAVPGKGFSMENGVLTYPAPARFQTKALRGR